MKLPQRYENQIPSSFSMESFTAGSFEGAGDTRRLRVEPGEYAATVVGPFGEKSKIRQQGQFVILELIWQPDDPALAQKLGVERLPTCRQSIFLDITPNGGLDMGPFKNSELNKLRELWGINKEGVKWSFNDFIGRTGKIKVAHGANEKNPADPFVNVTAVSKL